MCGTPPHISHAHHDIPLPNNLYRNAGGHDTTSTDASFKIFESLSTLTEVVGNYLEQLYDIRNMPRKRSSRAALDVALDAWTDTLTGGVRQVILRGVNLDMPGAANLRLCFLAAKFISCRVELHEMETNAETEYFNEHLRQTRKIVEDIVYFVHELTVKQLGDFWLPIAAFVFSSTAAFLLRQAIQVEIPTLTPAQSMSLSLVKNLLVSLRVHHEEHGWDLGEICLAEYEEVVEKVYASEVALEADLDWLDSGPLFMTDPMFFESIITDQWESVA